MGRIRQHVIKSTAFELLKRYGNLFTADYEANKKIVDSLIEVEGKKTVNRIAGYLTRVKKHGKTVF